MVGLIEIVDERASDIYRPLGMIGYSYFCIQHKSKLNFLLNYMIFQCLYSFSSFLKELSLLI